MHRPICRDRPPVLLMAFLVCLFAGTPTPSTAASERNAQAMTILRAMGLTIPPTPAVPGDPGAPLRRSSSTSTEGRLPCARE